MKLTSLLLSSAAVFVAGSAFAADLPAKKAAPAAAVTACPAFGAGFFQLPGSDTCLQLGGFMNYMATYSDEDQSLAQAGNLRLTLDARSNSEIGVIRGFGRIGNGGMERAYVQFSSLTVGINSSLADIAGTNAWNYGSGLGGGSNVGATYAATLGAVTLSLGIANSANNNITSSGAATSTTSTSGTPDLLLGVSTKAGPVDLKLVAVSHTAVDADSTTTQGYAVVGRVGASVGGGFGVALFGGVSKAAAAYTGTGRGLVVDNFAYADLDGSEESTGSNFGGEITLAAGNGTLALAADRYTVTLNSTTATVDNYGISYAYNVTKGLTIEPEVVYTSVDDEDDNSSSDSVTAYLRIQRDF